MTLLQGQFVVTRVRNEKVCYGMPGSDQLTPLSSLTDEVSFANSVKPIVVISHCLPNNHLEREAAALSTDKTVQ